MQEDIIGVLTKSGVPVAFPRAQALLSLKNGKKISVENIQIVLASGGLKAIDTDGSDLGSHEAFWFAWSQLHPTTKIWKE